MDLKENVQKEANNKDENIKEKTKRAIPLKNRYTLKQKLDVVKEAEITSIHATSNKYGIDRASIRDWIKQKSNLEKEKIIILLNIELRVQEEKFRHLNMSLKYFNGSIIIEN